MSEMIHSSLLPSQSFNSIRVISAKEFGIESGVCNRKLLQDLQDRSELLRIPIDFSGIREICFDGYISIGDWFHWRSSGRFDTTIKPVSLTRATVGSNGYGIYAWFTRKDPEQNLTYAMLEDIGMDGQYQGGYEIKVESLIRGFCWHADRDSVLTDITALRCHFKNMPHEAWEGYTTNGGTIDGIRYLYCSSEGEDPEKTSVGFNAFKCMNGSIDSPSEYGIYTIRNIVSRGNTARGHRTLTDLKRGCEKWSISLCNTYDMNDCHHSTDGSRDGIFSDNIGEQTGKSYRNKNFLEIQGEYITVTSSIFKGAPDDKRAGVAGILITNYQYPSLPGSNESKNIHISNCQVNNIDNGAIRIINASNVKVNGLSINNCKNGVSFERNLGMNKPLFNTIEDIVTHDSDTGLIVSTDYPLLINTPPINGKMACKINNGTIIYRFKKPYFCNYPPSIENSDILLKNIGGTSSDDRPIGIPYAIELDDSEPLSVREYSAALIPVLEDDIIYFSCHVKELSSPESSFLIREYIDNEIKYSEFIRTGARNDWNEFFVIYHPSVQGVNKIEILLCPATDDLGNTSLQGKTLFSKMIISKRPI
ncbi:hypothetical protein KKJ06_21590 [Xenorhabdus bovienii]|uniref:Bifunctional tail n=1 Tax=Xenorhabdus bovienii str. Intermedium TaxID=1379677 RepID=A0A077QN44_XENBV